MKIHDVAQGSPEWLALRAGIPTASEFDCLITPAGKASTQSTRLLNECLAGWLGAMDEQYVSEWMERGTAMEAEARSYYEMDRGVDVSQVGFITWDNGNAGCSPDGLIGEQKGLEVKCPKPSTHIGYLLKGELPTAYKPQVYGSMLITGFREWDFMSYHPDLEPLIITVKWDDEYIGALSKLLNKFVAEMLDARALLTQRLARAA